jgi:hypothetical protein
MVEGRGKIKALINNGTLPGTEAPAMHMGL